MRYRVIRTYSNSYEELQKLFEEGWQYKSCHQSECREWLYRDTYKIVNCLEYILYKKD